MDFLYQYRASHDRCNNIRGELPTNHNRGWTKTVCKTYLLVNLRHNRADITRHITSVRHAFVYSLASPRRSSPVLLLFSAGPQQDPFCFATDERGKSVLSYGDTKLHLRYLRTTTRPLRARLLRNIKSFTWISLLFIPTSPPHVLSTLLLPQHVLSTLLSPQNQCPFRLTHFKIRTPNTTSSSATFTPSTAAPTTPTAAIHPPSAVYLPLIYPQRSRQSYEPSPVPLVSIGHVSSISSSRAGEKNRNT